MSKEELCALLLLIISLKLCSRSKGVKLSQKKSGSTRSRVGVGDVIDMWADGGLFWNADPN